MNLSEAKLGALLNIIVKEAIREGQTIELDGLGTFEPDKRTGLHFIAQCAPRVFIAYADEDTKTALRLADNLASAGLKPWIDKRKLLPGQNWKQAIKRTIEHADFFVPCFSSRSVNKRGQFPYEVRLAMRCADTMPLDDSLIVPVRLDLCEVPHRIKCNLQYVDLFPDFELGTRVLTAAIWQEFSARLLRHC